MMLNTLTYPSLTSSAFVLWMLIALARMYLSIWPLITSCSRLITDFTRVQEAASSLIDFIFISGPTTACEYDCHVIDGISDHRIIIFECPWPGPQDSALGLLLSLLCVNDTIRNMPAKLRYFANDAVL